MALEDLRSQNRELLNRLQAEDVKTFKSLQHSSKLDDKPDVYYPRSDEAEALQVKQLYSDFGTETWGLGDTLIQNDDEYQTMVQELGLWEPDV